MEHLGVKFKFNPIVLLIIDFYMRVPSVTNRLRVEYKCRYRRRSSRLEFPTSIRSLFTPARV